MLGLSKKIMEEAFPYLGITTIAESGERMSGQRDRISEIQSTRITTRITRIPTITRTVLISMRITVRTWTTGLPEVQRNSGNANNHAEDVISCNNIFCMVFII